MEKMIKAGIATLEIAALALASCGPAKATEKVTPTGESVDPTKTLTVEPPVQTEVFTQTLTETATPEPTTTETPTPTETPEKIFVPEGFQIGELGLLRDPETGKDVIIMNPEADWEKIRVDIIGGLWEANVDWANYTGQGNDAQNYTKEAFIEAALQGKMFHIGIPVRLDGKYIPDDPEFQKSKSVAVVLKMVNVKLDNIQIQVLDPYAFEKYTGMDWSDDSQEAYPCLSMPWTPSNVCLNTIEKDNLVISVGNLSFDDKVIASRSFLIGHFDTALYEKYPKYFRPDGIGVEADHAISATLGEGVGELGRFSIAHDKFIGQGGNTFKVINIGGTFGYFDEANFYLHPNLFIFSK